MPQTNLEVVRRLYETGDAGGFIAAIDLFDPEIEFDLTEVSPDQRTGGGREAFGRALSAYMDTFEEWHVELLELVQVNADQVLAVVRDGGRVKGSQQEIYNEFGHLWTLREGRLVGWAGYTSKARALEVSRQAD